MKRKIRTSRFQVPFLCLTIRGFGPQGTTSDEEWYIDVEGKVEGYILSGGSPTYILETIFKKIFDIM